MLPICGSSMNFQIATATYAFVRAREHDEPNLTVDVPLTPRHSAGVVAMWEREDVGRLTSPIRGRKLVEEHRGRLVHAALFRSFASARWWIWWTAFGSLSRCPAIAWKSRSASVTFSCARSRLFLSVFGWKKGCR